jgi:Domain of unknown function (DUF397)
MDLNDAVWRKASRSTENGGNCVEVAAVSEVVAVRDSKDPDGAKLLVSRADFLTLAEALKKL